MWRGGFFLDARFCTTISHMAPIYIYIYIYIYTYICTLLCSKHAWKELETCTNNLAHVHKRTCIEYTLHVHTQAHAYTHTHLHIHIQKTHRYTYKYSLAHTEETWAQRTALMHVIFQRYDLGARVTLETFCVKPRCTCICMHHACSVCICVLFLCACIRMDLCIRPKSWCVNV